MTDDDLLDILETQENEAAQYVTGDLRAARDQNTKEFFSRPYGNEEEGWSQYVSSATADTIEWMLPGLLSKFLATDKAVEFKPTRKDEVEGAKQATQAANHVFHQWNNGFLVLYTAFKDALQVRNCAVTWRLHPIRKRRRSPFQGMNDIEVAIKIQTLGLSATEIKTVNVEYDEDEEEQSPLLDPMAEAVRLQMEAIGGVKRSGRVCWTEETKTIKVEAFEPENLLVHRMWTSPLLADCPYVCRMMEVNLSDLRQMGFGANKVKADDLAGSDASSDMRSASDRRKRMGDDTGTVGGQPEGVDRNDESQTTGWLRIEWVLVDYDGDGIAERREIYRLDDKILSNEECEEVPVCTGSPVLVQHQWDGLSYADLTSSLQLLDTELTRAVINNAYSANNPRRVVLTDANGAPRANIDDILDGRPGIPIREFVQGAVRVDDIPYVGNQMEPLLNRVDQLREQRTGVTKQRMGLDPNSIRTDRTLGETQLIDTASKQREDLVARIFAETIVAPVMKGILRLLTSGEFDQFFMELRGQFIEYNPNEWSDGYRMKANVGLGTGDNDQKAATLRGILASQMQIAPTPLGYDQKEPVIGPDGQPVMGQDGKPAMRVVRAGLVKPKQIFNTLEQLADLGGFQNVGEFFTDPGEAPMPSPPPSPPPYQVVVKEMELKAKAQDAQAQRSFEDYKAKLDAEAEQRQQANQNQVQAANDERDSIREQLTREHEAKVEAMQQALDKYKVDADNRTKIAIARMQNPLSPLPDGFLMDEATGAIIGPDLVGQMNAKLEAILDRQFAPKRIIPGPDGRPAAVAIGDDVRPVTYDENGRINGHE